MRRDVSKQRKSTTKDLAVCAMLSALGVVLLYLGSFVEIMDMAMAAIASFAVIITVIEYGKGAPWAVYGVTSILSLILLPQKTPAAFYALFFGFYPIIKEKIERKSKILRWVIKEVVFNICFALMALVTIFFFTPAGSELETPLLIAVTVILGEVAFILYDIALTRMISFYVFRLRDRLRINKNK